MLGAAFAVLAKRDQHLGLAFDVGESNPVGAKGYLYHRYSNEFGNDDRIWALSWKETIHTTIKAIHQQGCNINGLSIEGVQLRLLVDDYASCFFLSFFSSSLSRRSRDMKRDREKWEASIFGRKRETKK